VDMLQQHCISRARRQNLKLRGTTLQQAVVHAPAASGVAVIYDPLKCATLPQMELPNDGDQNSQPDR
jgi:hypothetical protein